MGVPCATGAAWAAGWRARRSRSPRARSGRGARRGRRRPTAAAAPRGTPGSRRPPWPNSPGCRAVSQSDRYPRGAGNLLGFLVVVLYPARPQRRGGVGGVAGLKSQLKLERSKKSLKRSSGMEVGSGLGVGLGLGWSGPLLSSGSSFCLFHGPLARWRGVACGVSSACPVPSHLHGRLVSSP